MIYFSYLWVSFLVLVALVTECGTLAVGALVLYPSQAPAKYRPPSGRRPPNTVSLRPRPRPRILTTDIHHNYGFFTVLSSPTTDDLSPTKDIS